MKTVTTNRYDAELYTDNAGGAYLYAICDGKVVWGASYPEVNKNAAGDLLALVEGHDPVAEGWEHGTADDEFTAWADDIRFCEDAESAREIASTYCYDGTARSLLALDRNGWPKSRFLAKVLLGDDWEDMWDAGN